MALLVTNLISTGSATDAQEYAMPSAGYPKDSLILFSIMNTQTTGTAPAAVNTITGLTGATWEEIQTVTFGNVTSARLSTWRTMIATTQDVIVTASFGGVTNQTGFVGIIDIVTGSATSGTGASGAILQSISTNSAGVVTTGLTITLASTPANAVYGIWAKTLNSTMSTPLLFTQTADEGAATPAKHLKGAWKLIGQQAFASTQPIATHMAGIGIEFNPQTTGGAPGGLIYRSQRLLIGVGV